MNKLKELREWLNLILTLACGVIVFMLKQEFKIAAMESDGHSRERVEAIRNYVQEGYVSKVSFESVQNETNRRLERIDENVSRLQQDFARISGRLYSPRQQEQQ